jgi:hypothetical protein
MGRGWGTAQLCLPCTLGNIMINSWCMIAGAGMLLMSTTSHAHPQLQQPLLWPAGALMCRCCAHHKAALQPSTSHHRPHVASVVQTATSLPGSSCRPCRHLSRARRPHQGAIGARQQQTTDRQAARRTLQQARRCAHLRPCQSVHPGPRWTQQR